MAEGVSGWGGTMASVEHELITCVWGQSPQQGPGEAPLKLKAFWSWMSNGAGTDSLNNNNNNDRLTAFDPGQPG